MAVDSARVVLPWIAEPASPKVIDPRQRGETRTLALGANWRYRARSDCGADIVAIVNAMVSMKRK